jgi:hypothetical protein
MLGEYKPFKVRVKESLRYWEDEDTGLDIYHKRGSVEIPLKFFRSANLRDALVKGHLLIDDGDCTFAYRGKIVNVKKGKSGNVIQYEGEKEAAPPQKEQETKKPQTMKKPAVKEVGEYSDKFVGEIEEIKKENLNERQSESSGRKD